MVDLSAIGTLIMKKLWYEKADTLVSWLVWELSRNHRLMTFDAHFGNQQHGVPLFTATDSLS